MKVSAADGKATPEFESWSNRRPKIVVALMLTFASGFVDIIGYLGVYHLFAAHLTGTSVQLGTSIIGRNWVNARSAAVILGAFFFGSMIGRIIIEIGWRRKFRSVASVTLAIEAAMLVFVAIFTRSSLFNPQAADAVAANFYWVLAVLAGAMGLQTATLTRIGPLTVHTTFVTGMVNKLAQLSSHIVFRTYDLLRVHSYAGELRRSRSKDVQQWLLLLAIWILYMGGAAVGTLAYMPWGVRALLVPTVLLLIGVATDQACPLSVQEEKEQSEQ